MANVVGVSFKGNNKKYYFGSITNLNIGDKVVVDTIRGLEIGTITQGYKEIKEEEIIGELKNVVRKATQKDLDDYEANLRDKPELYNGLKEIIDKSNLEMKFLDCEYTLDRTKLLVYFSAEGRVDFRELVKEIASVYKTRIELRQVGPRDASRIIGGIGICGMEVCCKKFLGDIQNVTIKMAKNQSLSLNPTAISGLCGKLLCCIYFEDFLYSKDNGEKKELSIGEKVKLENGEGVIVNIDNDNRTVTIKMDTGEEIELSQ